MLVPILYSSRTSISRTEVCASWTHLSACPTVVIHRHCCWYITRLTEQTFFNHLGAFGSACVMGWRILVASPSLTCGAARSTSSHHTSFLQPTVDSIHVTVFAIMAVCLLRANSNIGIRSVVLKFPLLHTQVSYRPRNISTNHF
jgi:hypothetical protein